ncbi:hypothetical protein Holit_01336 [Hollandina sp. SP2]
MRSGSGYRNPGRCWRYIEVFEIQPGCRTSPLVTAFLGVYPGKLMALLDRFPFRKDS